MPFFEKDKFHCEIVVNPSADGNAIFLGESISGCVKLQAQERATMRGIILSYTVREYFACVPTCAASPVDAKRMLDGSRLRHKMQCLLLGSRNHNPIEVHPGEYSYPFLIEVPKHVPPTCPPTILGYACDCCNCCNCLSGGTHTNVISVEHLLGLEIIIPYSLLDKSDIFQEVFVQRSVHPSELEYPRPRLGVQESNVLNFGALLPQPCLRVFSCLLREPKVPSSFRLDVVNPLIVLTQPRPIQFVLRGTLRCPFVAMLMRRCRVSIPGRTLPVEANSVLSYCLCPPIQGPEGSSGGTLSTSALIESSQFCPASIRGTTIEVAYYVVVRPQFESEPSGVCVDYLDSMKVMIAVDVVHCTSNRVPMPTLSQNPGAGVAAQVPNDVVVAPSDVALGVVFGYLPPAGFEGQFAPAGPVLESLSAPVWGTLVV